MAFDPQQQGVTPPVNPTGVTFDFSKAVPVGGSPAPATQPAPVQQPQQPQQQSPIDFINKSLQPLVPGQSVTPPVNPTGVTFDFSKAVPVEGNISGAQPTTHRDPHSIVIKDSDSILTKGVKAVGGALEGVGEGVFGTLHGIDKLVSKIPGVGEWLTTPIGESTGVVGADGKTASQRNQDKEAELAGDIPGVNNGSWHSPQNVGKLAEMIGEFYMGSEALKGLSASTKLGRAAKLVELVEDHPILARIIGNGLSGGIVGGAQGYLKSDDNPDGALNGAVSGAIGGAVLPEILNPIGKAIGSGASSLGASLGEDSGLGSWLGKVGDRLNPVAPVAEDAATIKARRFDAQPGTPATKAIPATQDPDEFNAYKSNVINEFNGKVLDSAQNAVQDVPAVAQEGAEPTGYQVPASPRDYFGASARAVYQSAKADFAALDEASGGQWQRFDNQIRNLTDQMGDTEGVDEGAYAKAAAQRDAVMAAKDTAMQQLVAEGKVDPAIAERAQTSYKRAMALQDVDKAVKMSTERAPGPEPGDSEDNINPTKLSLRLQKLNDIPINGGASRLEQALGKDGAQDLINKTDEANFFSTAQPLDDSVAAKDATGQQYLKSVLQNNLLNDKGAGKYNWQGVLSDLNKLPPDSQQLDLKELTAAKSMVQDKIRKEAVAKVFKAALPYVIGSGTGLYELHHLLSQ